MNFTWESSWASCLHCRREFLVSYWLACPHYYCSSAIFCAAHALATREEIER